MPSDLTDTVSPPAQEFARRITPRLLAQLADHKDAIIASGSSALVRWGIRLGWDQGMRVVPHLADSGTQAVFDEFGGMSLTQVASLLLAHNRARGVASHPSLQRYVPEGDPHVQ